MVRAREMKVRGSSSSIADGATGKPLRCTKLRARILSPISSMLSGVGPMKAIPAAATVLANSAFSD